MAFFGELSKVISDKSREAAGKVKDLTGVLQLKSRLSAEKEKVNKAYITLGKAYYETQKALAEEAFPEEMKTIAAGLIRMAELEDEIAELEGTRTCAECGARVERNAAFCSKCGAPMTEPEPLEEEEPLEMPVGALVSVAEETQAETEQEVIFEEAEEGKDQ